MAEEIKNAAVVVPRAMIFSIAINGIMGFGMLLALLFCLGDPETALSTPTGYPFIAIFLQAVDSVSGALTMSAIITTLATLGTISWVAGASRMTWSFARDRGLPGWRYLSKVSLTLLTRTFQEDEFVRVSLTLSYSRDSQRWMSVHLFL